MPHNLNYNYKNLTGTQVTQISTNMGVLHSVVVNNTAAGAISIVDGVGGTTATIATLKASIAEGTYIFDCVFGKGLRVAIASNSDITLNWSKSI